MQHQISNYTFTIFDKFQYENRTEKQGQFSCKNAGQKSLWFNYIYIFLNKVFNQVSEHTYIVLQESKGKKKTPHDTLFPPNHRNKKLSVTFAYDYKKLQVKRLSKY